MNRAGRWAGVVTGGLLVIGLIVAAVLFGQHGVEVMSWLASIGSLLVALVTLFIAAPPHTGRSTPRILRFSGKAKGNGVVMQAGRDIHNADTRQRPQE
ncbi:hypothetical protein ACQP00_09675 [Dactylosporangium sp. CS-047395]|uniref:hypothetical protein n=1 Tax=Dactylosporangium sp. CS-047395 TaxID=3239936 RepID=UPI003D948611